MDEIDIAAEEAPERWTARPALLAGLGLGTGIVVHLILGKTQIYDNSLGAVQTALVLGATLAAALIGFTVERRLWWAALLFGAAMGVVAYFVTLWNGAPGGWSSGEVWRTMSLVLALAIAAPLFQTARDEDSLRPSYIGVHDHVWANVVLWCASWLFVAIVWVMAILLASLFHLIKIEFVQELLAKDWFGRAMTGLAFGSALGLLREHDAVVRTLQRVVAIVLAVLAPVLAIGLGLFLLALPFTGVRALWEATSETTPLLLACAAGALILANVVIGREDADERRNPLLRYGAMLLGLTILPLGALAAVATSLRIGQYGYTPERLWAVVFVGVACLWGAAYLVALVRGRIEWTRRVRPTNLVLAALVCVLGFVLATPLISFNAISTRDQVGRLESGKTSPETFDWRALAFDFGKPGRDALARLVKSPNAAIREKAIVAAKTENRFELSDGHREAQAETLDQRLRVLPAGTALPPELRKDIAGSYPCGFGQSHCTLAFLDGGKEAVLLEASCFAPPEPNATPTPTPTPGPARKTVGVATYGVDVCSAAVTRRYLLETGKWIDANDKESVPMSDQVNAAKAAGYKGGQVEVRKVERRQLFVGGQPIGDAFE